MRLASASAFALVLVALGCSSNSPVPVGVDGGADAGADGGADGGADAGGSDATAVMHPNEGGGRSDAGHLVDAGGLIDVPSIPANLACTIPVQPIVTTEPTTVVKTCDEATLSAAVKKGGIVTFDCGGPSTITLTAPLAPPTGIDTTLDGGGSVTLDGGGMTRILSFNGGGYRTTSTIITVQNLTFENGFATGTRIPAAAAPCSQGFETDAGGGAIYVLDGKLHVFDSTFVHNTGQTPGPDVAGGGIYVDGSLETIVVGSKFNDNTSSNGGAIGSLNSDLSVYTTTMNGNTATGTGQNNTSSMCSTMSQEIGDGGSGGAIYMDGGSDGDTTFCGDVFEKNHANALGGAVFRVFDDATHAVNLSVSTVDSNVADGPVGTDGAGPGAGAFYFHNTDVNIDHTTISGNSSPGCGALQADASTLALTNVTLANNVATAGIGGAICIFSNGGTLTNCTLAGNQANGGTSYSNYYGAAIFGGGLTLANTILSENITMNSEGRMTCAATESGSDDLQWPVDKVVGGSPDTDCVTGITFADPKLGPLQNNGGPTLTLAPGAASSVIQIGAGCPTTDQAGKTRSNPCTIGAVEE